jgi:hypothetical protein
MLHTKRTLLEMREDALRQDLPAPDEACARHHCLHQGSNFRQPQGANSDATTNSMVDSNAEPERALSYTLEAQEMFAAEV